jgi:hypothetical protein
MMRGRDILLCCATGLAVCGTIVCLQLTRPPVALSPFGGPWPGHGAVLDPAPLVLFDRVPYEPRFGVKPATLGWPCAILLLENRLPNSPWPSRWSAMTDLVAFSPVGLLTNCALFAVPLGLLMSLRYRRRHQRLRRRREHGLCLVCGYALRGNTSGVCSECGTATSEPLIERWEAAVQERSQRYRPWIRFVRALAALYVTCAIGSCAARASYLVNTSDPYWYTNGHDPQYMHDVAVIPVLVYSGAVVVLLGLLYLRMQRRQVARLLLPLLVSGFSVWYLRGCTYTIALFD